MYKIFLVLVVFLFTKQSFSQCLTDHFHQQAIKSNPQIKEIEDKFYSNVTPASTKRATKYIIPVVFHVIHTNGPENISEAQINDQIRILNEDFSLNNANKANIRTTFKNLAVDCEIEFRLAKIDPNGQCTNGINRIYNVGHSNARDEVKGIANARWDYRKYLNIWTVSSIRNQSGAQGVTLGYAYLPQSVAAANLGSMDGIVMRADYVGSIGTSANNDNAGRTLTHEVGHYLGLLHTFDDENGCSGQNDRCADTPPVASTFANASCPANNNSCTNDVPDLIDQWENYMDYSRGTCQAMFTPNQKSIMHGVITGYSFRTNLVSNNNLIATGINNSTGAPIAFFTASKTVACVGDTITFFDKSCKAIVDSRTWTLTGSSVISTNLVNPKVIYNSPGKYNVSLKVNNGSGNNTLTINQFIEILPKVAIQKPTFRNTMEDASFLDGYGMKILDQGNIRFRRVNNAGFYSTHSLKAPCDSSIVGQRFQLVLPPIDLTPTIGKQPKISMMIGHARKSSTTTELFRIYYKSACQSEFTQIVQRTGSAIAFTSSIQSVFPAPTTADKWKLFSFNLTQFENEQNIQFMIEVESAQGFPVYIDDINIGIYNTEIDDIETDLNLNIFPNPVQNSLNISLKDEFGNAKVDLLSIDGKEISNLYLGSQPSDNVEIKYQNDLELRGVYLIKITVNEQVIIKKLIFAD